MPQPLINDLWVFLFQKIDAECLELVSRARTSVGKSPFMTRDANDDIFTAHFSSLPLLCITMPALWLRQPGILKI